MSSRSGTDRGAPEEPPGHRACGDAAGVDAIEAAVEGASGHAAGVAGYAVAWQVARTNLLLGATVVVDAMCPVPASRAGWVELASDAAADLVVLETRLDDVAEHRRRVEGRRPDLPGQRVPSWAEVLALDYAPWDEARDGARTVVDTASTDVALTATRSALGGRRASVGPGRIVP